MCGRWFLEPGSQEMNHVFPRRIQVITSLEQECVPKRAVVSGLIQVLDELLERPWRAGVAERPLESVEGGILGA